MGCIIAIGHWYLAHLGKAYWPQPTFDTFGICKWACAPATLVVMHYFHLYGYSLSYYMLPYPSELTLIFTPITLWDEHVTAYIANFVEACVTYIPACKRPCVFDRSVLWPAIDEDFELVTCR